ncbi:hypothetical protein KAOT1_00480 [Kordia algicida OT-1]|uniref:Lipocalin-like domain-containing protein n=2 Tax=Kordia TaxID=221065 RepID=A9E9U7_9FLAO|nr:hypothetical protein KAOT1_00480 [Kordia algicida OT-1]
MKNMKFTIVTIVLLVCMLTSCKGQSKLETQQTYSTEIIGIWENNSEAGHKLEFLSNGILKIYSENQYVGSMNYAVVITCNGHTTSDNRIFLSLEEDGDISCSTLETVNEDNNNFLSMTTEQGKLETYTKVN